MDGLKIAAMTGVREYGECDPVELWINEGGRLVIRSYNECGNNCTDVDLADLLNWLKSGRVLEGQDDGGIAALSAVERN